jgi:hypothetical protein
VNEIKNLPQSEISRRKQAKTIRFLRKLHRITGLILLVFILNMAITGILIGWGKNSYDYILPDIRKGSSSDLKNWVPLSSLEKVVKQALSDFSSKFEKDISCIDIWQDQGIVKFIFENHYCRIQFDVATKNQLTALLEQLYARTFVEHHFSSRYSFFKLFFTSNMRLFTNIVCHNRFLDLVRSAKDEKSKNV